MFNLQNMQNQTQSRQAQSENFTIHPQQVKELYQSTNNMYWDYISTCFRSCIRMVPIQTTKDQLENSQPNQQIKSTLSYGDEILTQKDKNCLKACSQ